LLAELAEARAHVAELEARLAQNSSNSSKPPSSDPPSVAPRSGREPSGKKRGGQPGHRRYEQTLLPPERVREVVDCLPAVCRRCGKALPKPDREAEPVRHQVVEIPKVVAMATEYRLHRCACEECGITTLGQLPPGIPSTMVGPRLAAVIAVCGGAFRISKRMTQELLANFFDVDVSLGTIAKTEKAASEAVAPAVAEVGAAMQVAPVVHADETGWREARAKAWLWVAATPMLAFFLIRRRRGGEVAKELLGAAFKGILCADRWSAYNWVNYLRRQFCWAHLRRHFKLFVDLGGDAHPVGTALVAATKSLFKHWHRVRDGTLRHSTFVAYARPLRDQINDLLRAGMHCRSRRVASMCGEILEGQHSMWTFLRHVGVEPTNNHAERTLRHAVVWRKTSGGTDSELGSRFVERMLTTVQTLRLQKRNVLDFMVAACQARLHGTPTPSLLPAHSDQPLAIAA
jgi:transposase